MPDTLPASSVRSIILDTREPRLSLDWVMPVDDHRICAGLLFECAGDSRRLVRTRGTTPQIEITNHPYAPGEKIAIPMSPRAFRHLCSARREGKRLLERNGHGYKLTREGRKQVLLDWFKQDAYEPLAARRTELF